MARNSRKWTPGLRVRSVHPLDGFRLRLTFSNDSTREIDLDSYLSGPVFEPLRADPKLFGAVRIYPEGETIYWPNGADIAPETLYEESYPVEDQAGHDSESSKPKGSVSRPSVSSPRPAMRQTSPRRMKQARSRKG
jgi:hypothetical protein